MTNIIDNIIAMIQSKKALYDIPLNMTPQSLKKSLMPFNRVSKIVLL